jgi:hypothetical protein
MNSQTSAKLHLLYFERENEENIDNEGLGDGEAEDAAADY